MKERIIAVERDRLWKNLVSVETKSGLTGAPLVGTNPLPGGWLRERNAEFVTIQALGVVQIATSAVMHAKGLLLILNAIKGSIESISKLAQQPAKGQIEQIGSVLLEKLILLEHRTRNLLADLESTQKRGEVQIAAVISPLMSRSLMLI